MTINTRTMYSGTVEYLEGTVTADVVIGADVVAVSFDRTTWFPAAWVGPTGLTQTWQILLGSTVPLPSVGTTSNVYVKITDNPEAPILKAGVLIVR